MYVTREIETMIVNLLIYSGRGRRGGGGEEGSGQQMWAVVNKTLMHSIVYMLKFPR